MIRKIIYAAFASMLGGPAIGAEVPGSMPHALMGEENHVYLIVKQGFSCNNYKLINDPELGSFICYNKEEFWRNPGKRPIPIVGNFLDNRNNKEYVDGQHDQNGIWINFTAGSFGAAHFVYKEKNGDTFGDISKLKTFVREWISIEYEDPYEGLDDAMLQDTLLKSIIQKMETQPKVAAWNFVRLRELKKDKDLPESFYYQYIKTLSRIPNTKDVIKAELLQYFKKFGRTGKYYDKVLEIQANS